MNDVPAGTYTSINIHSGHGHDRLSEYHRRRRANDRDRCRRTISLEHGDHQSDESTGGQADYRRWACAWTSIWPSRSSRPNGAITGTVTPTFDICTVTSTDNGGYIDELIAGVVSVQRRPSRLSCRDRTANSSRSTSRADGVGRRRQPKRARTPAASCRLPGKLDPADQTLDADEVAILSDSELLRDGQITYVTPSTGAATSFDLYVRGLEPTSTPEFRWARLRK